MNLNRYELASIKRTAQNVKVLRKKLSRQDLIIEKAMQEKKALEEEISLWEAPLINKYGMTSEDILKGEEAPEEPAPEQELSQPDGEPIAEGEKDCPAEETVNFQ